jgi:hypothetical protein
VAAQLLAEHTGLDGEAFLTIFNEPVVQLYADVHPTFDHILNTTPHMPLVWTQGEMNDPVGCGYQRLKFQATRLLERYPPWAGRMQANGLPVLIGGYDKQAALTELITQVDPSRLQNMLIVDDSLAQLFAAHTLLQAASITATLFQIDRTAPPQRLDLHCHRLNDLTQLISHFTTSTHLILVDLDYTLIDHLVTRQHFAAQIERLLAAV